MFENLKLSSTQVDYSVTKKSKNVYDNRCFFLFFMLKCGRNYILNNQE